VPIRTLVFERTSQAAIAITGLSAYTNGFDISVTALIHPDAPGFDAEVPNRGMLFHQPCQIGLRLADGREVVSGRPRDDAEPAEPFLRPRGGGGTSHYRHSRWWAWPLPPSGPLEFVCQWPTIKPGELRVSIDAQLILDAARQSVQLWPAGQP
jgi:hypothetical protein